MEACRASLDGIHVGSKGSVATSSKPPSPQGAERRANWLAGQTYRDEVEIVLVNRTDRFVERPRLHQLATGQPRRELPLLEYLKGWRSASGSHGA